MQSFKKLKSGHVRQPQIEHDAVERPFLHRFERFASASDRHQFDIVVVQQFHDRTALDVVVLHDQQSLRARRGELLEPVECGLQAVGGRLLDEIGERTVRQAVLPLLFQSDDLDRDVARHGIELELIEHRPAEHIGQEDIERDGGRLVLTGKRKRRCSAGTDDALEALVPRQIRAGCARNARRPR